MSELSTTGECPEMRIGFIESPLLRIPSYSAFHAPFLQAPVWLERVPEPVIYGGINGVPLQSGGVIVCYPQSVGANPNWVTDTHEFTEFLSVVHVRQYDQLGTRPESKHNQSQNTVGGS